MLKTLNKRREAWFCLRIVCIHSQENIDARHVIALLREPRLALLDRHPIDLRNPAGQATVKLGVRFPLEKKLRMDDVAIHAQSHLEGVHLGGIVAGHDLDQGAFDRFRDDYRGPTGDAPEKFPLSELTPGRQ